MGLDTYDKKIIAELNRNSRQPVSKIAKNIKQSKETVNYRIKRLVNKGYIDNFRALINASMFGYNYYQIFLKFQKTTKNIEKKILSFIIAEKSNANLRLLEGYYDISFMTIHKNPGTLQAFLRGLLHLFGAFIIEKNILIVLNGRRYQYLQSDIAYKEITCFNLFSDSCVKLDALDYDILKTLASDCRIKNTELARALKAKPQMIQYRIKRLEKKKIIVAYHTNLNLEKTGLSLTQIDIALHNLSVIPSLVEFFNVRDNTIFAYELLGRYDLSIELYVNGDQELRQILDLFKKKYASHYIYYEVSRIFKEHITNWSPFPLANKTTK